MRGKRENVQIWSLNSSTTQLASNISFVNIQICTTNKERYIACKEILPWKVSVFYKKVWSNIWTFIGKQTRGRYKQTGLRSDYNLEIDIIDRFWWSSWIIVILIQFDNKDDISQITFGGSLQQPLLKPFWQVNALRRGKCGYNSSFKLIFRHVVACLGSFLNLI